VVDWLVRGNVYGRGDRLGLDTLGWWVHNSSRHQRSSGEKVSKDVVAQQSTKADERLRLQAITRQDSTLEKVDVVAEKRKVGQNGERTRGN